MSGLLSRVMNMKFMNPNAKVDDPKKKKVVETSEWALPNASQLKKSATTTEPEVGFGAIAAATSTGRRAYGQEEKKEELNFGKLSEAKQKPGNTKKMPKTLEASVGKKKEEPQFGTMEFLNSLLDKKPTPEAEASDKRKAPALDIPRKKKRFS